MSFRPAVYPCSSREPHEEHQHTDGPDNYMYLCKGRVDPYPPLACGLDDDACMATVCVACL